MRFLITLAVLLFLAAGVPRASAVVTLGLSNQTLGLTGIGGNSSGDGQSTMTWGSCAFDGTNTTCTLSGLYTGLGAGGTYSFIVSYAGSGAFPLNAVSQSPGSDEFFAQATNNFSFQINLAETGGPTISFYSFANFNFTYSGATCTGVAATACGIGQVGLTPNATIVGPITGTFDPTPMITPSGVISGSDYGAFTSIAPATWIEIYGVNLATTRTQHWAATDFTGVNAPVSLGGTTVTVAGQPSYVDFVSPGQVNVQVPSGVPTGSQPVVLTTAGGSSLVFSINVNTAEPGLLAPLSFEIQGAQHVVALFSNTLTYVLPVAVSGAKTARAKPGDQITLYGIGFGQVTPDISAGQIVQQQNQLQSDLQVTFAGVPATVTYDGFAPGYVGLYQFNVTVPNVAASDTVSLAFTLGGVPGQQNLVIAIQN